MTERKRNCYMLTEERFGWPAGTIVYDSRECDYGMRGEDERATGKPHKFVCVDTALHPPTRGTLVEALRDPFPNFTVPVDALMLISSDET